MAAWPVSGWKILFSINCLKSVIRCWAWWLFFSLHHNVRQLDVGRKLLGTECILGMTKMLRGSVFQAVNGEGLQSTCGHTPQLTRDMHRFLYRILLFNICTCVYAQVYISATDVQVCQQFIHRINTWAHSRCYLLVNRICRNQGRKTNICLLNCNLESHCVWL